MYSIDRGIQFSKRSSRLPQPDNQSDKKPLQPLEQPQQPSFGVIALVETLWKPRPGHHQLGHKPVANCVTTIYLRGDPSFLTLTNSDSGGGMDGTDA